MKRMHRVLSSFSRGSKNARLNQLMFRNLKTVETNANGTSGYVIKSGKNSGETLGHLKKETKKLYLKKWDMGHVKLPPHIYSFYFTGVIIFWPSTPIATTIAFTGTSPIFLDSWATPTSSINASPAL